MWMLKLLGSIGHLRDLVTQLVKVFKNTSANVRRNNKDKAVDDAISDALAERSQLRDSRSEEQPKAD